MKKLVLGLLCFLVAGTVCIANAEKKTNPTKERQKIEKQASKELNAKASKDARKEAKNLKKQGWKVSPGALPLEKMLDKAYIMQYEYDDDMLPKYAMGEGMSKGTNYDGAKFQALEVAKINLANQLQTELTSIIENTLGNTQSTGIASEVKSILASKNLVQQSLGRVQPVVEAYREDGKNVQVMVRVFYSTELAKQQLVKSLTKELEDRGNTLHDKLDDLLGW